jgi:hypothetical protein
MTMDVVTMNIDAGPSLYSFGSYQSTTYHYQAEPMKQGYLQ